VKATALLTLLFHAYVVAPEPLKITAVPAQTVWFIPALTLGAAFTVTVACAVLLQPLAFVPVTVYVAVDIGVKATELFTLLFHAYVVAPEPLKVTAVPAQTVWLIPALTLGAAFTVTVACAVLLQPLASVPVTVYVVVDVGVKAIALFTLLFHAYVVAPDPLKVTAVPAQTVWLIPALTLGAATTVTVACAVLLQPLASVPVTVYVAVDVGVKATALFTLLFHAYVVAPDPLKVTAVPAQTV